MRLFVSAVVLYVVLAEIAAMAQPQEVKTKNVVIVTLDGYRWKELFGGADPRILHNPKYVKDTTVWEFADDSETKSREKLMPFLWNVIGSEGQLYGNRLYKNKVKCVNPFRISYPGYSEMLVGFNDFTVRSNAKKLNPNRTVLEFLQAQSEFRDHIAAFSTWDAFPYILRESESGIYVNAGVDTAAGNISDQEEWLNRNQAIIKNPHGPRYDAFTFRYAMEYLKRERPKILFLSFDETDEHGHGGRYDEYLKSAHQADQMIGELWQWLQTQDDYKDKTTMLITTDHGRGSGKKLWKSHKALVPGSGQIWFAVIGPDTPSFGEMKTSGKYYQKQVAKTIAAFLGEDYQNIDPVGDVVQTMLSAPVPALPETTTAENSPDKSGRNEH
jgi:hypothetical protein